MVRSLVFPLLCLLGVASNQASCNDPSTKCETQQDWAASTKKSNQDQVSKEKFSFFPPDYETVDDTFDASVHFTEYSQEMKRAMTLSNFRKNFILQDADVVIGRINNNGTRIDVSKFQRISSIAKSNVLSDKALLGDAVYKYAAEHGTTPVMPRSYRMTVASQVEELAALLRSQGLEVAQRPANSTDSKGKKKKKDKVEKKGEPISPQKLLENIAAAQKFDTNTRPSWIFKPTGKGSHGGRGIHVFTDKQLAAVLLPSLAFQLGVVQKYLPEPLLLGGNKFDLRPYITILSVEPAVLLLHEGIVRRAAEKYEANANSTDINVHITNFAQAIRSDVNGTLDIPSHLFPFNKLQDHLDSTVPANWARTKLLPRICCIVRDLFQSMRHRLGQDPRYFSLLGVDILMAKSGEPWLLEVQFKPSMHEFEDRLPGYVVIPVTELWRYILRGTFALLSEQRRRVHLFTEMFKGTSVKVREDHDVHTSAYQFMKGNADGYPIDENSPLLEKFQGMRKLEANSPFHLLLDEFSGYDLRNEHDCDASIAFTN